MTARLDTLGRLLLVLLCFSGACAAEPATSSEVADAVSTELADRDEAELAEQQQSLLPRDQDTPQDRRIDCFTGCLETCGTNKVCASKCTTKCTPRLPAYYCSMQDNSVNHYLCEGAMYAWNQACNQECGFLGPFTPLCKMGCEYIYKTRSCPDASICV